MIPYDFKRWWWNVRFALVMNRYTGFNFGWYSAKAWDQADVDEFTPSDAVYEDMAHWYD